LPPEDELVPALFKLLDLLSLPPQDLVTTKWQLQARLDARFSTAPFSSSSSSERDQDSVVYAYAWLVEAVRSKDAASVLACLRRKFHLQLPD